MGGVAAKTVEVSEIFCSIQGESSRAGRRCAFVRLSGCDMGCAWCDTRYANEEPGREMSLDEVMAAVRSHGARLVEITGGEPLLQAAMPELAVRLAGDGFEVLVETGGGRDISLLPSPIVRIMDLKPPSSGVSEKNRRENLSLLRRGDEVKIVVADRVDYEWARAAITDGAYPADLVETLLSPLAGVMPPAVLVGWMLEDRLEARLNLQLHKIVWPNTERGV